eukprot:10309902-Karenia_brevis.AAC.1
MQLPTSFAAPSAPGPVVDDKPLPPWRVSQWKMKFAKYVLELQLRNLCGSGKLTKRKHSMELAQAKVRPASKKRGPHLCMVSEKAALEVESRAVPSLLGGGSKWLSGATR